MALHPLAHGRTRTHRVPGRALVALALALSAFAAPASAQHDHHAGHAASATAPPPQRAAHDHGASAVTPAAPAAPTTSAAPAGWQFSTPTDPRIAKGPRGPLWSATKLRAVGQVFMGGTAGERYVAAQLEKARGLDLDSLLAQRAALSTSQATKKLSKKCQKLVKITKAAKVKKLSKADKKARTKCLEQRRKIIADSKKKPTDGSTTPTTGGSTTPGTGGTTSPGTGGGGTTNPGTGGSETPGGGGTTNPGGGGTTNPGGGTTDPGTPTCTPLTGDVLVAAISDEDLFSVNFDARNCSIKAGTHTIKLSNVDTSEPHNLVIANKVDKDGYPDPSGGPIRPIIDGQVAAGSSDAKENVSLTPGTYYFVCMVPGHGSMSLKFTVTA